MCSRCRTDRPHLGLAALVAIGLLLLAGGCDRERREFESRASDARPARPVVLSNLSPGPLPPPSPARELAAQYEGNAYHVGEGQRLFKWFNCNGCHGNGGGSIGPALMDGQWRYGGSLEQIRASIEQGRPNGMPSFAGKIPSQQMWQLAAYVRSLSGNVRKDVPSSRREGMSGPPPLTRYPAQGEHGGDKAPVQAAPP
jgi:cytochrome c oxidase cbb3-type subunit III